MILVGFFMQAVKNYLKRDYLKIGVKTRKRYRELCTVC